MRISVNLVRNKIFLKKLQIPSMFKSTFYINFITSIILIVILSACIARNYKHEAIVEEWIGKELIVPEELVFQIQDTQIQCNFNNADFKIVTYIDSAGCTSCRMKLREWESFINDLNTLTDVDVNFLMVVNKIEKDEVCRILRMNSFKLPVSIDSCGIFKTANTIPKEFAHSTFLIDSQNRIVAIGNPIDNPKIRELYARILITANNELSLESQSILDIDRYKDMCENNVIAFGTANTGDTIKRIFRLENKSHDRLTIQDLIPSCNCVSASVCKNIIEKGGYSDIEMAYIADSLAGSRKMQVKIFFEEEERPYIISMHGFVIKKSKI